MSGMRPEDLLARIIHGALDTPKPAPHRPQPDADQPTAHWTNPLLLERVAYLRKMARAGEGFATDTLRDSPGHRTILVTRLRNSPAESFESIAQFLLVLEGRATLITGGLLDKPRKTAPGHNTGNAITGGDAQELLPGDVLHIAPGVPTEFHVPNEKPFSCLIVRITVALACDDRA
ncbi:MAG TPA: hypothetical protein VGL22_11075 [Terracidiphilus sp.]|jgi:hypothetical protein